MNGPFIFFICACATAVILLTIHFLSYFIASKKDKKRFEEESKKLEEEIERRERINTLVKEILGDEVDVFVDHDHKEIYVAERIKDDVDNSTNW